MEADLKSSSRIAFVHLYEDKLIGLHRELSQTGVGTRHRLNVPVSLVLGRDFSHDDTLDVPTQVELLIKQATSHENLCQCYIGW